MGVSLFIHESIYPECLSEAFPQTLLCYRAMENGPSWDRPSARTFYLEQLKIVRAEADKLADETRITERFVLGGCGGIFTFAFVQWDHLRKLPFPLLLSVPLLLVIWGGIRSLALYVRIKQCATFLTQAEEALPLFGWKGWEHWLNADKRKEHYLAISAIAIWTALVLGTAAVDGTALHAYRRMQHVEATKEGKYEVIGRTQRSVPNAQSGGIHTEVDYVLLYQDHKLYTTCDLNDIDRLDPSATCSFRPLRKYTCRLGMKNGDRALSDLLCKDADGHNVYLYVSKVD